MKFFKAIAAMSENRVIGCGNQIPWHLPEDFQWFKRMTLGHVVVMGRKTFESIGRPLTNRKTLVLTRHPRHLIKRHPEIFRQFKEWRGGRHLKLPYQFHFTKFESGERRDLFLFNSLEKLRPDEFVPDVFVCGGAEVYAQMLGSCSDLYLTLVKRTVEGDAFFPPFEDRFTFVENISECDQFVIRHYRNNAPTIFSG